MLLGSLLDLFEAYSDQTNVETHANSPREPRNEYALAAASVTDFQASTRPRWGDGGRLIRRFPLVDARTPPPFHQPASTASAASTALPTALTILQMDVTSLKISICQNCRPTLFILRIRPLSLFNLIVTRLVNGNMDSVVKNSELFQLFLR